MYRVIKIGEKEVPMLGVASVDIYYKRIFREDPLSIMTSTDAGNGKKTAIAFGMGFVMAKLAETKDRKQMLQLTENDYLEWLEQFDYGDYVTAAADIIGVYYGQKANAAIEKNAVRQ